MSPSVATKVVETISEMRAWREGLHSAGGKRLVVGFVPTMGALHAGHMSLVHAARQECERIVVSIFVNPLQFGKGEDFDRYPRPLEKDLEFCRQAGVDVVFHPGVKEMYPHGQSDQTTVIPPAALIGHLCGAHRPGHFEGVATVVTKLFGQVLPDRAYFGEKDYQQLTVIRRMVSDLNLPVVVVPAPTWREPDGLAMSSRNVYLNEDMRKQAPCLYETLCFVRDSAIAGKLPLKEALAEGRKRIEALAGVTLQYLEACDLDTLAPLAQAQDAMVILVAAKFGDVRLIDNLITGR